MISSGYCDDRKDADFNRMRLFLDKLMERKKALFDDVYGPNQLHLAVLCTLPAYQKRGAGTMHCKWGIEMARRRKYQVVTLFASPMGRKLYQKLDFTIEGTVIVQVKGERERLDIKGMAYVIPEVQKNVSTPGPDATIGDVPGPSSPQV